MTRNKIIIICFAIVIIAFVAFLFHYLNNASVYGTVSIKTKSQVSVTATSPLNKPLNFVNNKTSESQNFYYDYKRFYKNIIIKAPTKELISNCEIKINGESHKLIADKIIKSDNFYEYKITTLDYPFYLKVLDLIVFVIKKFKFTIIFLLILAVSVIIIKNRTKIIGFFSKIDIPQLISKPSLRFQISSLAISLTVLSVFIINSEPQRMAILPDNSVHLDKGPDQFDYHTIAINYANGEEFLINGIIKDDIDYKFLNGKNKVSNIESISGIKALNRFPAYPFIISIVYKIFGANPISIKIFQIIILITICLLLPLITYRVWGDLGFFAGLFASPLIFNYLLPFTSLILPDILSTSINFFTIFLWIENRTKFNYKKFIVLALLLGLGFLVKASIILILPIIFIDLYFRFRKQYIKKLLIKFLYFSLTFAICWVPYNIYSIGQYYRSVDKSREIIIAIERLDGNDFIQTYSHTKLFDSPNLTFDHLTVDEINTYKNIISPQIEKTGYLPYNFIKPETSSNLIALSYIKLISMNKKPYFMISLISNYGALECHNEYVTDGRITNEWLKHSNSFYNNDGMSGEAQILRIMNFYLHNPSQLFKISHSKLVYNICHTTILKLFTFASLFLLLVFSLSQVKNNKTLIHKSIGYFFILFLCVFNNEVIPYFFILTCVLILLEFDKSIKNLFPLILLAFNGIAFSLLSFSSPRYMIYYMFALYIVVSLVFIKTIISLKHFKEKTNGRVISLSKK
jgi:4-amino-4-deoxy-L-arabinose transferase-like glycosyltransferase